ncbi:hypothetical protein [Novosphingobium sp. ST904]|uniref:hypothetical protein n=1 Tax=Novosphingobium sp. ST904 TaxID=1684385 RepID=UPI0006C878F7|nr:hypothetical protein [Novosphingobium sp. ST904]KPH59195.1 hypothetical protein ADT71_23935 [Novosphingobium sp. ST904]TCM37717.1 hypothetical protein EDF59_110113 [Novosphingobium sp. ST904]
MIRFPFNVPEGVKQLLDALSITALLGSLMSLLPAIASILTILWTAIRIYETPTIQRLVNRREEEL